MAMSQAQASARHDQHHKNGVKRHPTGVDLVGDNKDVLGKAFGVLKGGVPVGPERNA